MLSWFHITLFTAACLAHSIPPPSTRSIAEFSLEVQLYHADGSAIKAVSSNRGKVDVKLLKPRSILEAYSKEEVHVSKDGKQT
jgi:hypothetical protein